ncbi:MAG: N-6 DNA methylase [Flavobacteriaceae bacterium]|nr:N-6 DNA methylase [Flavobacteriaceae bacterium]MCY4267674.1 N-6 DNA methylase [Flavobacteriaceae bacterium]
MKIVDYVSGKEINAKPEEIESVQVMSKLLVEEYGYPKENIKTHPQYRVKKTPSDKSKSYPVDIAVFNSSQKNESTAYILVECKRKNRKDGIDQLRDYLTFSQAKLGIWFNGEERYFTRKIISNGNIVFSEIPNIPKYGERLEDIGKYKRKDLKPPQNLKVTFKSIRNYMAGNTIGSTDDKILAQQIINLIFCKIYDEKFTKKNDVVNFRIGLKENEEEIVLRIRKIFNSVKSKYEEIFTENDHIRLDNKTIAYIVGELQSYCLSDADRDVIAEAFETFTDPVFKGSQGQFFTPKNIVKLLVEIVNPNDNQLIIDPACGSGGFLVESLRHIWNSIDKEAKEYNRSEMDIHEEKFAVAVKNIFGIEKDEILSKITKMYMALLGDGKGSVFSEDSLLPPTNWASETTKYINLGKYDILFTNPPFGKNIKITGREKLQQFELAGKKDSMRPEILFLERSIQFLKSGGIMAIILPETFFHAVKSKFIMKFIKKHNIKYIVDLPHNTFRPYNNAKCIAVVFQKDTSQQKNINLVVAEQMGHDHTGKDIYRYDTITQQVDKTQLWDDIPLIIDELKGKSLQSKYTFTVSSEKMDNNSVYVPRYYWRIKEGEIKDIAKKNHLKLIKVSDIIDNEQIFCFNGHGSPEAVHKGKGEYPYVRVRDIVNWEIFKNPTARVPEHVFYKYVKEDKVIKEKDILFIRRGSYRIGSVAMASKYDNDCLLTNEISVLRTKKQGGGKPILPLIPIFSSISSNADL